MIVTMRRTVRHLSAARSHMQEIDIEIDSMKRFSKAFGVYELLQDRCESTRGNGGMYRVAATKK